EAEAKFGPPAPRDRETLRRICRWKSEVDSLHCFVATDEERAVISRVVERAKKRLSQNRKYRHAVRDDAVDSLVRLWAHVKTGNVDGPIKVGTETGPLIKFLVAAYQPLGELTPGAAREIVRSLLDVRRKSRGQRGALGKLWAAN